MLTIALDMDGVLVDFEKGVSEILGISHSCINKSSSEMTQDEKKEKRIMYAKLSKMGDQFWKYLDPMPDGLALFDHISDNYNYGFLTAYVTSGKTFCIEGKKEWIKNNLNVIVDENNFICCRSDEKQNYTKYFGNPTVLIDDRIRNVHQFRDAGGLAILHTDMTTTIKELEKIKETLNG